MSDRFPHLKNNESAFPYVDGVDVYKYDNSFDYNRFDASQMEIMVCTVPWDMGEAHVGNRTISGIGNVVWFETKEKRDEWFASIPDKECFRYTSKYKALHRDNELVVDIPFDVASNYNYVYVKYNLFANDGSLVVNESAEGRNEWFWFIREVEFLAPNSTKLYLMADAWQTFMYDITIHEMMLERGHAPMFSTTVEQYLNNPVENNEYLLADDVNFGDASQVKHIEAVTMNDGTNMYACIATTANPTGNWSYNVPASSYYMNNGAPSVYVFAVAAGNLNTLLTNIDSSIPQFKQTVQGVFFASNKLVTLAGNFTFANVTCYGLASSRKTLDLVTLAKTQFGYPTEYQDIAKLYTMPYAHIELTDEDGQTDIVRIEDTTGKLQVSAMLSLAYPFISVDAHLLGVGGNATKSVTFKNLQSNTFDVSGQWYKTLKSWNVPTFAVVQQASTQYDYSTHFDRAQRVADYTTQQNNENANADTMVSNASLAVSANTASTNRSNTSAYTDSSNTQSYNTGVAAADNILVAASATSTINANEQQGNISAAAGIANGVVGVAAGAATGNPLGAVTSGVGAIIGAASTLASTAVANGLTAAQATYTQASNSAHATASNTKTSWDVDNQANTNSDLTGIQNSLTSGTTANSAATMKANATRSANAAQSAIDNDVAQAALGEPLQYGTFSDGQSAVTKPMSVFAHIVTQSKGAIATAGDEMLRYGYMFDRRWEFDGDWNIGKHFTYWKLKDFWISGLKVPDMYVDKIRFFLLGGVTIWRKPEEIGRVSIYENFGGE